MGNVWANTPHPKEDRNPVGFGTLGLLYTPAMLGCIYGI